MEKAGSTTRAAAEVAALATRPAKNTNVALAELRGQWRERARQLGHDLDAVAIAPSKARRPSERTADLAGGLLGAED